MFSVKLSIFAVTLILMTGAGCSDNIAEIPGWQLADGTAGQSIVAISIYRNNPDTVYALGVRELLRSTDGGHTWNYINNFSAAFGAISVDPENSDILYASVADPTKLMAIWPDYNLNDIVKLTNGGKGSKILFIGKKGHAPVVQFDPVHPQTVYAGVSPGTIMRSDDSGQTWDSIPRPGPGELFSLAINPSNDHIIYAGYTSGIYKSTDRGKSWQILNLGFNIDSPTLLTIDSQSPETVYAGIVPSSKGNYQGGVYKTTDGGKNWQEMDTGLSTRNREIWSIAINPKNPDQLFLGLYSTHGHLCYESTNGGGLWTDFSEGLPDSGGVQSIAIDTTNNKIYCGWGDDLNGGLYTRSGR